MEAEFKVRPTSLHSPAQAAQGRWLNWAGTRSMGPLTPALTHPQVRADKEQRRGKG